MSALPIRARLTLTYVALLVLVLAAVLGASWLVLARHLARTLPEAYADPVLAQVAGQYVLALLGAALVAVAAGWVAAGSALGPLRRIADTAARVGDDRLGERIAIGPRDPDDELRELALALNAMLDRLAGSVAAQGRFVANASHELRTPLTVIRTGAEVVLDDPDASVEDLRAAARQAVDTVERTDALIDALLVLSGAAARTPGAAAPRAAVALEGVARRALDAAAPEAAERGTTLRADLPPVQVRGDAALLERLVGNLVENALRHGAPGVVRVRTALGAGGARVTVENDGDHIPGPLLDRLPEPFERLHRSGDARGSGLGLSIVRAVAEAHGGRLELTAPVAGGLRAEVVLPAG